MRKSSVLVTLLLLFSFFYAFSTMKEVHRPSTLHSNSSLSETDTLSSSKVLSSSEELYKQISFDGHETLNFEIFEKALKGFEKLKIEGHLPKDSRYLTVCDFSQSSNKKRLWVIDMKENTLVYNTLVSHGMGTGDEFAEKFSNNEGSHQSSLGFYVTESTYTGSNGYSLKLEGKDDGYNDAAMQRAIVMHGADYVSESFAKQHKRIGRSWGCPAVSREVAVEMIDLIKGKNCLFIYYPDQKYLSSSKWLS